MIYAEQLYLFGSNIQLYYLILGKVSLCHGKITKSIMIEQDSGNTKIIYKLLYARWISIIWV